MSLVAAIGVAARQYKQSGLPWEQIWEPNSAKPPQISATRRNRLDALPPLTCTNETTRTPENPWPVAHNLEVAHLAAVPNGV